MQHEDDVPCSRQAPGWRDWKTKGAWKGGLGFLAAAHVHVQVVKEPSVLNVVIVGMGPGQRVRIELPGEALATVYTGENEDVRSHEARRVDVRKAYTL